MLSPDRHVRFFLVAAVATSVASFSPDLQPQPKIEPKVSDAGIPSFNSFSLGLQLDNFTNPSLALKYNKVLADDLQASSPNVDSNLPDPNTPTDTSLSPTPVSVEQASTDLPWKLLFTKTDPVRAPNEVPANFPFAFTPVLSPMVQIPDGGQLRVTALVNIYGKPESIDQGRRFQRVGGLFVGNGQPVGSCLSRLIISSGLLEDGRTGWVVQQAIGDGQGSQTITPEHFAKTPDAKATIQVTLAPNFLDGAVEALGSGQGAVPIHLLRPISDCNPNHGIASAVWTKNSDTAVVVENITVETR